MRSSKSTHLEQPPRRRMTSIVPFLALLTLAAALQVTPAGAMVNDDAIGVCESVPGIPGGWNFTTGQPCTLGESAGGAGDSEDAPIWVEAIRNPGATPGETIYVHGTRPRCPDFGCLRLGPGRSAVGRGQLGFPDEGRGNGSARKGATARKAADKTRKPKFNVALLKECAKLAEVGMTGSYLDDRIRARHSMESRLGELELRLGRFRMDPDALAIGNLATREMLQKAWKATEASLMEQVRELKEAVYGMEPARDRWRDLGCDRPLKEILETP